MRRLACWMMVAILAGSSLGQPAILQSAEPSPPEGFRAIFNGRDLSGWHGLNPHLVEKLTGEQKEASLTQQRAEFPKHWSVENGELVNLGEGPYARPMTSSAISIC